MDFDSISIRDIFPFQRVDLDLRQFDGKVTAITGRNGAGKTTLVELLAAGLYRETATRGHISRLARSRSSRLEVGFTNGASHLLRHDIDAETGKGESFVFDPDGTPVLHDTKLRSFDAWAKVHLPAPEVLYSSLFGVQKSAGFLGMTKGERKGVLLRALGIEKLEDLAKSARERANAADRSVVSAKAARDALAARTVTTVTVREHIAEQVKVEAYAGRALGEALVALDAAKAAATDEAARAAEAKRVREERAHLTERFTALSKEVDAIDLRLANNRGLLLRGDELAAARGRSEEIAAEVEGLLKVEAREEEQVRSRAANIARAFDAERDAAARLNTERATLARTERDRADLDPTLALAATFDQTLSDRDAKAQAASEAQVAEDAARAQLDELREMGRDVDGRRVQVLRSGLEAVVASDLGEEGDLAADALDKDDALVLGAKEMPERVALATKAVADATAARVASAAAASLAERALIQVQAAKAEVPRAAQLDERIVELRATVADLERAHGAATEARKALEGAPATSAAATKERLAQLRLEAAALKPLLDLQAKLDVAHERIAELEAQRGPRAEELANVYSRRERLPNIDTDPSADAATSALGQAQAAADRALAARDEAAGKLASLRYNLSVAERDEEELERLDAAHRAAQVELDDWRRLADDLGRDGLQALEIDAAGPELTETVNDLLRAAAGSRWTVAIEMEKAHADGKGSSEGCEVIATDNERGVNIEAQYLSGGQSVVVGNALSLALALLACRRAGSTGGTIVRDESDDGLDAETKSGYVAMIRRAAEVVGAKRVFVVTHSQDVIDMVDACIEVADGKVSVTK